MQCLLLVCIVYDPQRVGASKTRIKPTPRRESPDDAKRVGTRSRDAAVDLVCRTRVMDPLKRVKYLPTRSPKRLIVRSETAHGAVTGDRNRV